MATWEYRTIPVQRASPSERWWAEVQAGEPMVGWEMILNFLGANGLGASAEGWELVTLLPLAYQVADQRLVASEALAVFKRPFHLQSIRAGWFGGGFFVLCCGEPYRLGDQDGSAPVGGWSSVGHRRVGPALAQ